MLRRFGIKQRRQGGVHADAIILAVTADKRAVQSYGARRPGRDDLKLRRKKILLPDAVPFVKQAEHARLDLVLGLVSVARLLFFFRAVSFFFRTVPENDVQLFGLKGI